MPCFLLSKKKHRGWPGRLENLSNALFLSYSIQPKSRDLFLCYIAFELDREELPGQNRTCPDWSGRVSPDRPDIYLKVCPGCPGPSGDWHVPLFLQLQNRVVF